MQLINPSTSSNELNTTLTPHSITHGDACFAYFNKIWGIPYSYGYPAYGYAPYAYVPGYYAYAPRRAHARRYYRY